MQKSKITPESIFKKIWSYGQIAKWKHGALDHDMTRNVAIQEIDQYAAQQVELKTSELCQMHVRQDLRQRERAEQAEKQLAEVTRQRDEAIRWAISFRSKGCPDPLQESFDWFMHTISQLENEKKDGE